MEKKSGAREAEEDGDVGNDEEKDSSEEIEPKLKYVRITNDLQTILCKDAASCIAVHPKFVCVGSHWGALHLFDHQGNSVRSQDMQAHTVSVNQISIDERGDHVCSCSDDGKVYVNGLYSMENSQSLTLNRLVKCVAIDPLYYKSKRFVTGDERLMLHEKAFLSKRSTLLAEAEGHVNNVRWCGRFIAWASSVGLRVYDVEARCSLGLIKWARTHGPERFRCNLFWKDKHTLLVGWVDSVRVFLVRQRNPAEVLKDRDLPEHKVEQIFHFNTDFFLCGIAPLDNYLVLLGCSKELDENGKAQRPQLYVVEPKSGGDFEELSTDCLSMRGYQEYSCNDYHLDCLVEESRFFIVSPKDVVVASPYDTDDRIQWLIDHERYEAALHEVANADKKQLTRHTLVDVSHSYIEHLLSKNCFNEAAQLCVKILGQDNKLWEEEVFKFARHQQLRALSPYLPTGQNPDGFKLNPHVYEMVLYEYIKTDHSGLLALVKDWPPGLYNVPAIVNAVMEHLLQSRPHERNAEMQELLEALAILYLHQRKFSKAFCMLVKFKNKEVFALMRQHRHYDCLLEMAPQLMELDSAQATTLFLHQQQVSPAELVGALEHNKYLLFLYLDALERRDGKSASAPFQHLLVELYAEYARERLLPFLRHGDQYPIETALDICQRRKFYPEMVYLLGRIGKTREALALIMDQLGDIEQGVEFCKEHDDPELWQELISSTVHRPEFVSYLLQKIGSYVDPIMLIERIQNGCVIEGLKKSLVKLLCDYRLQVSVQEGCKKILVSDYFSLHKRQVALQMRGVAVHEDGLCGVCQRPCLSKVPGGQGDGLLLFYCRHAFHQQCLGATASCTVCQPSRRLP